MKLQLQVGKRYNSCMQHATVSIPQTLSAAFRDMGDEELQFNVYHYRREFRWAASHDLLDLVQIALANTPEIQRPYGFRVQRSMWPYFPNPQLVIWGELAPQMVVLPVRDVDAAWDVCTIEVSTDSSGLHALIEVERACPHLRNVGQPVARGDRLFFVDHVRRDPFLAGVIAQAQLLEVSSMQSLPFAAAPGRWGFAVPQSLQVLDVSQIPVEFFGHRIVIHTSQEPPRDIDGSGLDISEVQPMAVKPLACGLALCYRFPRTALLTRLRPVSRLACLPFHCGRCKGV